MTRAHKVEPVTHLVLARLLGSARGLTTAALVRELREFAGPPHEKPVWSSRVAATIAQLATQRELLTARANAWQLTPAGTRAALAFLRWGHPPARCTWAVVRQRWAHVVACDVPFVKKPGGPIASRAVASLAVGLVTPDLGPLAATAVKSADVADALLARALGLVMPTEALTLDRLRRHVLAKELGLTPPHTLPVPKAVQTLAARKMGVPRADPALLEVAVIKRHVNPVVDPLSARSQPLWRPPSDFARCVRDAACDVPKAGRFGPDKVFISHVFTAYRARFGANNTPDLATFKRALLAAYRNDELMLSYADLVEAMNPADVADSFTPYLRQPFHFVRL